MHFVTSGHRVAETRGSRWTSHPSPCPTYFAYYLVDGIEGKRCTHGTLIGSAEAHFVKILLAQVVGPMVRGYFVVLQSYQRELEAGCNLGHATI